MSLLSGKEFYGAYGKLEMGTKFVFGRTTGLAIQV